MKLLTTIIILLVSLNIQAQDCKLHKSEWEQVEIKFLNAKNLPPKERVIGEGMEPTNQKVTGIEELSALQIKNIKQRAAKFGACVVYIEPEGFSTDTEIYYYWTRKNSRTHWRKIAVEKMKTKELPDNNKAIGEWTIRVKQRIHSLNYLPSRQLKRIKKIVSREGGHMVYIDFKDFWKQYQAASRTHYLYFYWI